MTSSEVGNLKSIHTRYQTRSNSSSTTPSLSRSLVTNNSNNVLYSTNTEDKNKTSKEDDSPCDDSHPLTIMYNFYVDSMNKLNPMSILTQVKNELQGYRDCVEKGSNEDQLPPTNLKEGDEFYRWSYWKKTSLLINKKTWTRNKFKEAAMKQYVLQAKKYISRLILS